MHLPTPESICRHDAVPVAGHLTALERRVVMLARRDADRGAIEPKRSIFSRLLALLTGVEGPQPLADDRLEALRRFVCFERQGDRRAQVAASELLGFGFPAEAVAGAAVIARA